MNKGQQIEMITQSWTDNMDLDSLMEFFYDHQVNYLESLTDEEFAVVLDLDRFYNSV